MRAEAVISEAKKAIIYKKTDGRCWYCGVQLNFSAVLLHPESPCIDHATPTSRGGTNNLANLLPSCRLCNSRKSTKTVEEYRQSLMRKKYAEFRAAEKLREALEESSSPFDGFILSAIEWLDLQIAPEVFFGEVKVDRHD